VFQGYREGAGRSYDQQSMGFARVRLKAARVLIALATCIGVVAAVFGAWLTAIAMALVVASQLVVYRRTKADLDAPE
jgi:hypothetical protein